MTDFDPKAVRAQLEQTAAQAKQQYDQAQAQLDKFDSVFGSNGPKAIPVSQPRTVVKDTVRATAQVRRGPQRNTKAKQAASAKPQKQAKAQKSGRQPKKAAAKTTNGRKTKGNANATEGRRAIAQWKNGSGGRPPLLEAMVNVMGGQSMDSAKVLEALQAKGWAPLAKDPRNYISYTFSQNKDVFEKIERGWFKVRKGAAKVTPSRGTSRSAKGGSANATAEETEAQLKELGISKEGSEPNPFGKAANA